MNKTHSILAGIALTVLVAPASYAATYTDFDQIDAVLNSTSPVYQDTFDLTDLNPAYDPDVESVQSALVSFSIRNSQGTAADTFTINVGPDTGTSGSVVRNFVFNGALIGQGFADLNETGIVGYRVEWTGGDGFILVSAAVTAETTLDATVPNGSVPEAGMTLSFLGLGLIGLESLRRKLKS